MSDNDERSADVSAIQRDLNDAIAQVLSRHEISMVTKWVALVEVIDGDGDRGLWALGSEGMTSWDTVGMLTYAVHMEQAGHVAAALD